MLSPDDRRIVLAGQFRLLANRCEQGARIDYRSIINAVRLYFEIALYDPTERFNSNSSERKT